ncbi:AAA family ATPase [Haloferax mediterranei ATCC 33500]|nr:CDC48 family AAA ATPase [Haloferax mediterranei]AFK19115.1 AAA-type ATPase (transitional ATPase-like protein) [Haloferax mediterranei ATCC 33500]AHZ21524.1 ATPase AAA [Haloferax mediterranei ATCC 33500]MDX5989211.1 CDC48 family AAA ATPase [Haloferax mediterranei ATCC 33500]QCQ75587.1 AAA family ATPase [Haloferax mediterranei ATCC 33500]
MSENGVTLVVRAAEKRDAGRGIARLPEAARRELGVLSGETVVIEGPRETVAKMWPARPGAEAGEMLVDADTRANAGVKIGDSVRVRKIDVEDARAVTLTGPGAFERTSVDRETIEEVVKSEIRNRPLQSGDRVRVERLAGAGLVVSKTQPDGVVRVTDSTRVTVTAESSKGASEAVRDAVKSVTGTDDGDSERGRATGVTYEDIGGLDDELDLVREMIELPLSEPEVFAHLGIEPPKGVLLHGPPGTGKTLIAKAVANEVNATFTTISGPEVLSKYKGESEEKLREVFQSAREDAPSIIFFDEIDSIAAKRDDGGDLENRVVGQLLSLMDGLDARGDVVVIGATNRADNLDPALRRGGRFDREIEIGVPNETGRREILDVHTRQMPLADDVDIERLASRTHGFVGADLESLAKEAAMTALRRVRREGESVSVTDMTVTRADFETAMASVEPSAMREYVAEQPTKGFEAVGGLDDVKQTLERAVTWPLTYAPLFEAAATDPPTGVLLHGPPGTGKTLLARAIAAESGVNFIHVAGPELLDRYVGESEKSVREVFERARQAAPSILFFDEIDAIATNRDSVGSDSGVTERVVSQLLTEMDNAADNPNLVVLAATNRRDTIDPALLRPGRLETHVEVPAPDIEARRAILDVHIRNKPLSSDVDLNDVAAHMDGYTGADVAAVCREAALRAIQDVANAYEGTTANDHTDEIRITREHFDAALDSVSPTLV